MKALLRVQNAGGKAGGSRSHTDIKNQNPALACGLVRVSHHCAKAVGSSLVTAHKSN